MSQIHTELGKIYKSKLIKRCKLLYHTHNTFEQCVYQLLKTLQSLSPSFPSIDLGRNTFDRVYYFNDLQIIHTFLQNKICSQLNPNQLNKFLEITQKNVSKNLDEIIQQFVAYWPVTTAQQNYEYVIKKLNRQKSLIQQNGYKKIQQQLQSQLIINKSPALPSKLNLVTELLIGLDIDKDIILIQFEMVTIEINVEGGFFMITHPKNLIDLNYKEKNILDKYYDYMHKGTSVNIVPGIYEIQWIYSGLALSTTTRWQQMAIKQYKTMRKKLKLIVLFRVWKMLISNN